MSNNIAKALADKNVIKEGVIIGAKISIKIFGEAHVIKERDGVVVKVDSEGVFARFEKKEVKYAKFDKITTIEGMDINRVAQAYKIKPKKK